MMIAPKIGIVVPVYKIKEQLLDECVQSLINQTYSNIHIVLVDDCSPDNCGKLAEDYAKSDDRISVIHHEKNRGLSAARNTGIENLDPDCKWVTFVDSDDWIDLNTCEKIVEYLKKWKRTPDLIIFSGCRNYPEYEMVSKPAFPNETWFEGREEINELQNESMHFIQKQFPENSINLDSACWRFISVEFMKKNSIRFIDIPYREDGLFFLYTTENAESIVYIYENFYHYRSTNNSMVNMYRVSADKEHELYWNEVWKFIHLYSKDDRFIDSTYYAILLSMEICIAQKFYHDKNKDSIWKKHLQCKIYFSQAPFCDVFKHVKLSTLRKNHLIKAYMIRMHFYAGQEWLRKLYNVLKKQKQY